MGFDPGDKFLGVFEVFGLLFVFNGLGVFVIRFLRCASVRFVEEVRDPYLFGDLVVLFVELGAIVL